MRDYRQIIIAFVIAVLFSIFVFSMVEAINPPPVWDCAYDDVRYASPYDRNMSDEEIKRDQTQMAECQDSYAVLQEKHDLVRFYVSVVVGVIAILIGMYVNATTPVGMAVASGLLLGGLFTVFVGTMSSWSSIGRIMRPVIILIELCLVIFVAYKKLNNGATSKHEK